jgi:hypothetical protein
VRSDCLPCMQDRHEDCDGLEHVVDQDGFSAYECGCYCNREEIRESCRHCKGTGFNLVTRYTKNRKRVRRAQ